MSKNHISCYLYSNSPLSFEFHKIHCSSNLIFSSNLHQYDNKTVIKKATKKLGWLTESVKINAAVARIILVKLNEIFKHIRMNMEIPSIRQKLLYIC